MGVPARVPPESGKASSTLASSHFPGDTLILLPFEVDSGKSPFSVHSSSASVRASGGSSSWERGTGRREPSWASTSLDLTAHTWTGMSVVRPISSTMLFLLFSST